MKNSIEMKNQFEGSQSLSEIFGDIVFAKRIQLRVSQEELAEKAKVESSVVHRIEGGSSVEVKDLEKVISALNLSYQMVGEMMVSLTTN